MIDNEQLRRRARDVLPDDVFAYYAAGAGAEVTLAREARAWDDVLLRPRLHNTVN